MHLRAEWHTAICSAFSSCAKIELDLKVHTNDAISRKTADLRCKSYCLADPALLKFLRKHIDTEPSKNTLLVEQDIFNVFCGSEILIQSMFDAVLMNCKMKRKTQRGPWASLLTHRSNRISTTAYYKRNTIAPRINRKPRKTIVNLRPLDLLALLWFTWNEEPEEETIS